VNDIIAKWLYTTNHKETVIPQICTSDWGKIQGDELEETNNQSVMTTMNDVKIFKIW